MFEAKIISGCWEEGTIELSGMPKDFILSARLLMVYEMDELNINTELLEACKWLLKAYKGMLKDAGVKYKKGQIPGITQAENIIAKAEPKKKLPKFKDIIGLYAE